MTTQESERKTGSSKESINIFQVAVYFALNIIAA